MLLSATVMKRHFTKLLLASHDRSTARHAFPVYRALPPTERPKFGTSTRERHATQPQRTESERHLQTPLPLLLEQSAMNNSLGLDEAARRSERRSVAELLSKILRQFPVSFQDGHNSGALPSAAPVMAPTAFLTCPLKHLIGFLKEANDTGRHAINLLHPLLQQLHVSVAQQFEAVPLLPLPQKLESTSSTLPSGSPTVSKESRTVADDVSSRDGAACFSFFLKCCSFMRYEIMCLVALLLLLLLLLPLPRTTRSRKTS